MPTVDQPKRFSPMGAFAGVAFVNLVALPLLLLRLYQSPTSDLISTPGHVQTVILTDSRAVQLPPMLVQLVTFEYTKNGTDGVAELMKHVDSQLYKDWVLAYLISMLLDQNVNIKGLEVSAAKLIDVKSAIPEQDR
jgi:hypothetical protein